MAQALPFFSNKIYFPKPQSPPLSKEARSRQVRFKDLFL